MIGVGNRMRGDDAAGLAVVDALRERGLRGADVVETEAEPTRLLDAWDGYDRAVVVDAVSSGADPGTVHRVDAAAGPLPHSLVRASTHHFSLGDTIELGRALGRLPASLVVYGVEGKAFEAGGPLSPEVERGVREAVARIEEEVG
ncbi:MAG: hydrogenase maturation protease [Pseudomonadota bacterium]